MYFTDKEIVEKYTGISETKAKAKNTVILGKSILAGMMIALGAACSNVAVHSIEDVGIARFVAGLVFPVGLMMVIVLGAELFTGDCLMIMGVMAKRITPLQLFKTLLLVYIGNFIGGILLSLAIFLSGQLNYTNGRLGAYTIKVALGKVSVTPVQAIASGILCNILVCAAVLMAIASKDITGKLLASFFVIMLFVTGGFEHCVANMYYITAGLLAKTNGKYVTALADIYGITDVTNLNVGRMLVTNLLPVTIGNIIGGSLCVGVALYALNNVKAGEQK